MRSIRVKNYEKVNKRKTSVVSDQTNTDALRKNI
nr:MAG TPA: hypothetical protein [Caudoviricetes sp.]